MNVITLSVSLFQTMRQEMSVNSIKLASVLESHGTLARPLFGSSNILEADLSSKYVDNLPILRGIIIDFCCEITIIIFAG